jgi:hypothetical protein
MQLRLNEPRDVGLRFAQVSAFSSLIGCFVGSRCQYAELLVCIYVPQLVGLADGNHEYNLQGTAYLGLLQTKQIQQRLTRTRDEIQYSPKISKLSVAVEMVVGNCPYIAVNNGFIAVNKGKGRQ